MHRGENKRHATYIYLTKTSEIKKIQIRKYLKAAIATERARLKIVVVPRELEIPSIMNQALEEDKALGQAFRVMRRSDQIDFAEYISSAKRVDTKVRRLAKIIDMIMIGEALHDKYR